MLLLIYSNIIYTLHKNLHIHKVTETAKLHYSKFRNLLQNYTNPHVKKLLSISIPGTPLRPRRLSDNGPYTFKNKDTNTINKL